MSAYEKLLQRFLSQPSDFTLNELTKLLSKMGYQLDESYSGSRIRYVRKGRESILIHKPHPKNVVPVYILKIVKEVLTREGLL